MLTTALRRAVVLLTLAGPAAAEETLLTGYVTDHLGRRLGGVTVTLRGPEAGRVAGTVSDAQGWYRMTTTPGRYELRFSRADFRDAAQRVTVAEGPVTLADAAVLLPALSVAPAVSRITVGGGGFRQTALAVSPRTGGGRFSAGLETLRTDVQPASSRRSGKLNGIARYDFEGSRHTSSMTGRVHYGRQPAGSGAGGADLLSLGLSYDREWSLTSGLTAAAGLQGDVYRIGVRQARTTAPDTRTTGAISPTFGITFDGRGLSTEARVWLATDAPSASRRASLEWTNTYSLLPWLTVDADVAWSWTREASVGVSIDGTRRWTGGVRMHGIGSRVQAGGADVLPAALAINAEAGYRVAPRTRLVVDVLNLTNASAADIQTRAASSVPQTAGRGVDDLLTDPVAPRTMRVSVQFGF